MATKKKLLQAAAGAAGGEALNVEDVFSTYLYEGNGSTQTITNGIDLDGEGGMVWIKQRTNAYGHYLYDTERGVQKGIASDSTAVEQTGRTGVTSFNSNGFSLGNFTYENGSGHDICSWTFRKAPKFFDVVTYTGTGSAQNISHNLGSVPAVMFVKSLDSGSRWNVYHKDASPTGNPENGRMALNTTDAWAEYPSVSVFAGLWNQTAPTDSVFTVGSYNDTNASGENFVAYLFAHNDGDGEFGPDGDADIIKCGSYTGNSTIGHTIDLGFEAQWVLVRGTSNLRKWMLYDAMRGMPVDGNGAALYPNSTDDEESLQRIGASNVGFQLTSTDSMVNVSGETYIYIAIRRGPMAVPEDATEVFDITTRDATHPSFDASFDVVDAAINRNTSGAFNWFAYARLIGTKYLNPNLTNAETTGASIEWDYMDGWSNGSGTNADLYSWMWKRAPNYFDVVAYTGNNTAGNTISHNLGVVPEMMWIKSRSNAVNWIVYHKDLNGSTNPEDYYLRLNGTSAETNDSSGDFFNSTAPTATNFTLGGSYWVNGTSNIAYLFASLDGVSKVGSYTGNDGTQNIDCGFSSGARFVLIKKSSNLGSWTVYDTERGIVAGNDAKLLLNSTAAETSSSDDIDPYSAGFTVNQAAASLNSNGQTYIFYAIA